MEDYKISSGNFNLSTGSLHPMHKLLPFLLVIGLGLTIAGCKPTLDSPLDVQIDWPSFMAQQDMVWEELPLRWENAPFSGNGLVGNMLYGSPDSTSLKLLLGRSDIGKLDFPGHYKIPNRLQLGSIDLQTEGKILFEESALRLDLWNGAITGKIITTKGSFQLRVFVALEAPLIVFETFNFSGEETGINWRPDFNHNGKLSKNGDITIYEVADTVHHERSAVESGGYVIAWQQKQQDRSNQLRVSVNSSPATHSIWNKRGRARLTAVEDALLTYSNTQDKTTEQLFQEQADWWHDFYPKSFISFGNKELESYYWIQLYKMAASSRYGYPMIDNHGIWSAEPVYGFATWDLNVQIIYRLHLASNHLDLGEPLVRFLEENYNRKSMYIDTLGELRAGLRQQTFLRYKYFDPIYWEHDTLSPCDGPAKFLWGCHNYWLQFQYTQDTSMLPKLRDMLEGGINAMKSGMAMEKDGKWHIPYGHSWETWRGRDPNAHLAVLNWALETIIKIETQEHRQRKWMTFQDNLTDYAVGQKGYMLGAGQGVKPHRHWSHLLHLYPLRTTTWEENPERYETSVREWADISTGILDGVSKSGYAPCGAMCLYAQTGKPGRIDSLIHVFLYGKSSRGPNVWASTMYREVGPVIETPMFFAAALQELFLQSKENTIKLFPAVPESMGDLVFHNYRTEGGFLISAKRIAGKTAFVKIESQSGNPLTLETDMQHLEVIGDPSAITAVGGHKYDCKLPRGASIIFMDSTIKNALSISPIARQSGQANGFGLNSKFYQNRAYLKAFTIEGR